jgi:hypothetical protein
MMTLRVAVRGPGSMGVIALRGVIDHPELQLVDLVVHSDVKAGKDAGTLCGIDPVGVVATTDAAGLLGGDAEVVVYAAAANLRPLEAVNDMVSILRAGKNVVSCSVVPLVYPDAIDATLTDPLREAALAGGVSFSPPASIAGSPMMSCRGCFQASRVPSTPSASPRCSITRPTRTRAPCTTSSDSASRPKSSRSPQHRAC